MVAACLARATRAPGATTTTTSLAARSVLPMSSVSRGASTTAARSIAATIGKHGCGALRKRKHRPRLRPRKPYQWFECHHSEAHGFYTQQSQRRCFSSFFRGGEEDPEKKAQNPIPSNATYTTTTTTTTVGDTTNSDREDLYRRPITLELWDEFRNEGQRTRDYLSSPSPSPGYQELASELQATIGSNALDIEPPPQSGPTGKWVYKFDFLADSATRVYKRYLSSFRSASASASASSSALQEEVVLEIPPETEVLAMSLTPDEACVACLQVVKEWDYFPTVKLRSVDSRKEAVLHWTGFLEENFDGVSGTDIVGLEWGPILMHDDDTNDNFRYSLYLLIANSQGRPDRVVLCQIDPSTLALVVPPICIYSSDDPTVMVDVQRTKGCSCVAIRALSKTSGEVFLSPGDTGVTSLLSVRPRQDGVVYHVDVGNEGDVVLLTSDENHPNGGDYFLEEASVSALPLPLSLSPTLPKFSEDESDFFVEDIDLFRTHIVLYERSRRNGDQRVRVRQRVSTEDPEIGNINPLKDAVLDLSSSSLGKHSGGATNETFCLPLHWSKLSPVGNMCFEASFFRFELESLLIPGLVYEYNFDTQQLTMVSGGGESGSSATEHPGGRSFRNEKVLVESHDGTRVPLSLFYKEEEDGHNNNNTNLNQAQTVVLVGYGAYGEPMDLGYNPGWKPLLDRGVVVAFAHTRGGGDLGRTWYARGRNEHKLKAIEDYEACAFYLRKRFDTKDEPLLPPKQEEQGRLSLVAKAFSAGGVLVGASVNRNPGLFDKVILTNAFVDVFSTMGNKNLFLTEHEYDEFGNPSSDPNVEARIRSYCPIYNLDPGVQVQRTMTRFLSIGTLDDRNVPYWNAALYFRKLLDGYKEGNKFDGDATSDIANGRQPKNDRVFLELQMEGGHHFSGKKRIEVLALENAFILNE